MWLDEPDSRPSLWAGACRRLNNGGVAKAPSLKDWAYPAQAFAGGLRKRGIGG